MECYNCAKIIIKKDSTKEHIPARALFAGYGDEYKINRITVPACKKCNNDYSKIDQEIRNVIGVTNDDVDDENARELSRKSVSSILKQKNFKGRLFFNRQGKVEAVKFDYKSIERVVRKDFKGIFYHEFDFALPLEWKVKIISDFERNGNLAETAAGILKYLAKGIKWAKSGHERIFKYKFKTMATDEDGLLYDSDDLDLAYTIASIQFYHDRFGFVVVATRQKYLNINFPLRQYRRKRKRLKK